MALPNNFSKALGYQGTPKVEMTKEGVQISGLWEDGIAPGVRLETKKVLGKDLPQYSGLRVSVKGKGEFNLRVILPDPVGFLDVIHFRFTATGEDQVLYLPFSKRSPLITSLPVAKSGSPIILMVEPSRKGKYDLIVKGIEWVKRESER